MFWRGVCRILRFGFVNSVVLPVSFAYVVGVCRLVVFVVLVVIVACFTCCCWICCLVGDGLIRLFPASVFCSINCCVVGCYVCLVF